jgi:hypothetical protein
LGSTNAAKEEIDSSEAIQISLMSALIKKKVGVHCMTHRMFLGLIMKHHLVQMAPVAINAMFWVRERFSAGRAKSLTPASTSDH